MRYAHIIFLQGDDYDQADQFAEAQDEWCAGMVEYLSQWENGEEEITGSIGNGTSDSVEYVGDFVLTWNTRMGYAGLARSIGDDDA